MHVGVSYSIIWDGHSLWELAGPISAPSLEGWPSHSAIWGLCILGGGGSHPIPIWLYVEPEHNLPGCWLHNWTNPEVPARNDGMQAWPGLTRKTHGCDVTLPWDTSGKDLSVLRAAEGRGLSSTYAGVSEVAYWVLFFRFRDSSSAFSLAISKDQMAWRIAMEAQREWLASGHLVSLWQRQIQTGKIMIYSSGY